MPQVMVLHTSACSRLVDPCVCLRRASRAVTHLYDLVLSPTGLKSTQFIMLQAIAERGEIAQWRLAEEFGIAVETLSRRLATLRKSGLISQRIGVTRPGERLYRLTYAGRQQLDEALPYWQRAQERLGMTLGDVDWSSTMRMAERLCEAAKVAESARTPNRTRTSVPQVMGASA